VSYSIPVEKKKTNNSPRVTISSNLPVSFVDMMNFQCDFCEAKLSNQAEKEEHTAKSHCKSRGKAMFYLNS
jgi:hypothetical protein